MPRRILPYLEDLSHQLGGIVAHYRRMLDDEFLFGAAMQVPQVATIFDGVDAHPLRFSAEDLSLIELLTLVTYRYGLESVRVMGHGGYAIVIGHAEANTHQRRVVRFVPDHHVRSVVGERDFDVRLDAHGEPLRDPDYPLLLSDLFLLPRHTTQLIFCDADGQPLQAAGYPAKLHCQLLPEVRAFEKPQLNRQMAQAAGRLLEAALATVGVSVADAHGGNGGALLGNDGEPLVVTRPDGAPSYIPIVLDYGYYAEIGAKRLAGLLVEFGIEVEHVRAMLADKAPAYAPPWFAPWEACLAQWIAESGASRQDFGRLLLHTPALDPSLWIDLATHRWQTIKEKTYPPLQTQARLDHLYPSYDEVIFPQRIETYRFTL